MWSQTYGGKYTENAYSVVETFDGGYALVGNNRFVKTDGYGNLEWSQTYDEGAPNSLVETSDGGYVLAGETQLSDNVSIDFWLAKTDEHGIIPEFPSWAILPLLLIATLAAIICKQRLAKASSK
jgi:hypothetical protein